jgi:hypothetical protein
VAPRPRRLVEPLHGGGDLDLFHGDWL